MAPLLVLMENVMLTLLGIDRVRNLFLKEIDKIIKRNSWQIFRSIIECLNLDRFLIPQKFCFNHLSRCDQTIDKWFHVIQTLESLIVNKNVI